MNLNYFKLNKVKEEIIDKQFKESNIKSTQKFNWKICKKEILIPGLKRKIKNLRDKIIYEFNPILTTFLNKVLIRNILIYFTKLKRNELGENIFYFSILLRNKIFNIYYSIYALKFKKKDKIDKSKLKKIKYKSSNLLFAINKSKRDITLKRKLVKNIVFTNINDLLVKIDIIFEKINIEYDILNFLCIFNRKRYDKGRFMLMNYKQLSHFIYLIIDSIVPFKVVSEIEKLFKTIDCDKIREKIDVYRNLSNTKYSIDFKVIKKVQIEEKNISFCKKCRICWLKIPNRWLKKRCIHKKC
jgi:hypothetical protein